MRQLAASLEADLARSASASYIVAAVSLDQGMLYLSEIPGNLGSDTVCSGVYNLSSQGFSVEVTSLPDEFNNVQWINRTVVLYECDPAMHCVVEGTRLFEGIITLEPSLNDGVLTITLGVASRRIVNLPDFGVIDKTRYPSAPQDSLGRLIPLLFGTVEPCPLIPLNNLVVGSLGDPAFPGDNRLVLLDAKDFPSYGAVWVDNESVYYSSHTDTELLGCSIKEAHPVGTAVVFASEAVYLAAGNVCLSMTRVKGDETAIEFDRFDTNKVMFEKPPLVPVKSEEYNVQLQFDQVASAAFTQIYSITYESVGTANVEANAAGQTPTTPSTNGGGGATPSTKATLSEAASYVAQSAYRAADFNFYGPIYYHNPIAGQIYGSTYADLTIYGRIVFTLTASKVLDIPVGAKATIKVDYTESVGDYRDGITISNSYAINGAAIKDSMTLDVVGTVTFTSTITLIVSTSHVHFLSNMTGKMMRVNMGASLTLEDIMANSSWGPWVGPNFDFKAATQVSAEWLQ